jgi:hypothetical protein
MKQRPRASASGCCISQCRPSVRVSGVPPASAIAGNASSGLQLAIASPRSRSRITYSGAFGSLTDEIGANSSMSDMSDTTKPGLPFTCNNGASAEAGARSGCTTRSEPADVEFDQPLGLVGQSRQCSEDAGHGQSTEQGCSIVSLATCTANTNDTRRTRDRHHHADNRQA